MTPMFLTTAAVGAIWCSPMCTIGQLSFLTNCLVEIAAFLSSSRSVPRTMLNTLPFVGTVAACSMGLKMT